ncbi:hypothetical protein C4D60_Mb03t05540 [Musa balbisiana]|uniref:Uncharacterized protein n=1 Tax=Musa balbisiana TaxID=52838 RepID=A0A4S8J8U2_MUSBA|nr:hypothetical protein C4D60_Mb03t05540 [Musa balbisiana]
MSPARRKQSTPDSTIRLSDHTGDHIKSFTKSTGPAKQVHQACVVAYLRPDTISCDHAVEQLTAFSHKS